MTAAAKKLATYEDLVALAPNMVGQIVFGNLHATRGLPFRMRSRRRRSVKSSGRRSSVAAADLAVG
jgi:hypothetical protein